MYREHREIMLDFEPDCLSKASADKQIIDLILACAKSKSTYRVRGESICLMLPGLMLVYSVVVGDMLVGKEGSGLLCQQLGGAACSRPLVVAVVTVVVLFPMISFR